MEQDIDTMSAEELRDALRMAQEAKKKDIVIKVSPKGCVQINGIRRFPVTFYKNEWKAIFDLKDDIEQFIVDNEDQLAVK
tara:strand:+ start:2503 stop:2742 length:240 start_codon:yes stop_codon:yes gene_type:complete